mmetsp:Transcript_26135/g.42284  ORF Transcript_26135/g.42284 Transcript_26135/m.42284 type:complete len:83 (+) Transcript_26135:226-474(+)
MMCCKNVVKFFDKNSAKTRKTKTSNRNEFDRTKNQDCAKKWALDRQRRAMQRMILKGTAPPNYKGMLQCQREDACIKVDRVL